MRINEYVKEYVNLKDLAVHYGLKLKRVSGGWMCKCPFHKDDTASLSLRDRYGKFRCFGCGERGDLFDFAQKAQGLTDFLSTASWLVETFNIPPPQKLIRQQLREQIRKEPDIEKAKALQAELLKIRKSLSGNGPGL